jgi:hypothetical protein
VTNDKILKHLVLTVAFAIIAAPASAQTSGGDTGASSTSTEATEESGDGGGATPEAEGSGSEEEGETTEGSTLSAPSDEEGEGEAEGEGGGGARTEAEAEEAQAAAEPLAWRNSFFSWTHGLTFNTFTRDGQQSYDPYYYWSFSLLPRWYLTPSMFLIASLGVSYELTDSNADTYNHELALSDALVELRYTLPVDRFVFIPAARLTFPTSKLSQAGQRYFNTGLGLTTVLQIPEFLSSNLALGLSYRRWWAGTNTNLSMGTSPGMSAGRSADDSFQRLSSAGAPALGGVDSMGGPSNGVDRILTSLTLNVTPVSGLTLTLQGIWIWDRVFDNPDAFLSCNTVLTTPCDSTILIPQDETQWRWRWFTYYTLAAAYDVQPWLNVSLGVANAAFLAPFFNDDGSVRSPFNPDTQVYLSATVTLDGLYETLTAGGEEDGLSPEERQRRRQGLAAIDTEILEEIPEDEDHEGEGETTGSTLAGSRATGAF